MYRYLIILPILFYGLILQAEEVKSKVDESLLEDVEAILSEEIDARISEPDALSVDETSPVVESDTVIPIEAEVLPRPQITGSVVNLRSRFGTQFDAYVVGKEHAQYGVILVHDEWGLNDYVKAWADKFAQRGYRAIAVDLFDGREVYNKDLAQLVISQIDPVWVDADLKAALNYLMMNQGKIVVLGWGPGAEHAVELTINWPDDISATIAYFSSLVHDVERISEIESPVLGVFPDSNSELPITVSKDSKSDQETWQATEQFLIRNFEF
ncbi:MAG: dienelactone hydrolase family protein [Gammaproteobacteria bacterium]